MLKQETNKDTIDAIWAEHFGDLILQTDSISLGKDTLNEGQITLSSKKITKAFVTERLLTIPTAYDEGDTLELYFDNITVLNSEGYLPKKSKK